MAFNLKDVTKRIETAVVPPAQKKARPNDQPPKNAPDLFVTLANTLLGIRQQVLDMKLTPDTVEIEFRLGMLVTGKRRWQSSWPAGGCLALTQEQAQPLGVQFVSGLDETAADRLKPLLLGDGFTTSFSEQRVRMGSNAGRRCVVDDQGRETISETKNKILRLDFGCVGHQYDGRLEVATEVVRNDSSSSGSQQWTMERLKRRTTFQKAGHSWQVDLTDVTTTQLDKVGGGAKQATELEFELTPPARQQWLSSCTAEEAQSLTGKLARELIEVLNICIVQTSEEGAGSSGARNDQIVAMPSNSSLLIQVKMLNSSIISASRTSYSSDDFLGSMPLNISRRNLLRLQREEYFVTEKSDGVRYLMYVVAPGPNRAAVAIFVDRAGTFFNPPGSEAIAAGLKVGTVLDGEIVFNLHHKKQIFLVFDILCNEGQPCAQLPFSARTDLIATSIMSKCGRIDYKVRPLWIIRKKFWPKRDLKSLLKMMFSLKGSRIYRESERRHHKSDGLIFQPNEPYVFGTDVNLVKWKWPELASVDLQVLPNARRDVSEEPSLMAGGPDRSLVDCCMRGRSHVGLGPFDTLRLLADVGDSSCRVHIAEVAFCPKVGLWSYFQLRKDKDAPNFINTVMSILMEQAEDIDIDELVARLLVLPGSGNGSTGSNTSSGTSSSDTSSSDTSSSIKW